MTNESSAVAPAYSAFSELPPLSPTKAVAITSDTKPFALVARLATGETIAVAEFATQDDAIARGSALADEIEHGVWPLLDGRLLDPEAIASLEVEVELEQASS